MTLHVDSTLYDDWAPARLSREDVAAIRQMYDRLWQKRVPGQGASHLVPLVREQRRRTLMKLGATGAVAEVEAEWSTGTKNRIGCDVVVYSARASGQQRQLRQKVATHRFRTSTTQRQFTREVCHYVRTALGVARKFDEHEGLTA